MQWDSDGGGEGEGRITIATRISRLGRADCETDMVNCSKRVYGRHLNKASAASRLPVHGRKKVDRGLLSHWTLITCMCENNQRSCER